MNLQNINQWLPLLGFISKNGTIEVFQKVYPSLDNYIIEVDLNNQIINYGNLIKSENKTTQNFSQNENFVVLECVNRLLETGYKPQNIILEKTYLLGHKNKGRLDILVKKENKENSENIEETYLMIECKTFGKEFDKAVEKLNKDGGQLFSYFQQDKSADLLMLYSSEFKDNKINYQNKIIKIEEELKNANSTKETYEKWNKLTKDNGVFDENPYLFKPKLLKVENLKDINNETSGIIFNQFLEILRHNVVSDKPNAFNKIFNLFLCKIYDEKQKEGQNLELDFQWKEGIDDDISLQLRLADLYKAGMKELLGKEITDYSDKDFENNYLQFFNNNNEKLQDFKNKINKLRLEKNNEFSFKEVYDEKSFKDNAKVIKKVVELLQGYKIRYSQKQQHLSNFFELLLTTGLKQESGQFFTPIPIAQFIIKSLPISKIILEKLEKGQNDLLPYVIDYSAGSGHFLTEIMDEIQKYLEKLNNELNNGNKYQFNQSVKTFINKAKIDNFYWAEKYIYGIEKNYRLVKVGKVGCHLQGDGLANVIHSDGLASFNHKDYKYKLSQVNKDNNQENKQFDIVISNPPYSVSAFKNASTDFYNEKDFNLYKYLTDNSSEIEALFIERTAQLLKDDGIAGIILPSSILSNSGIYTKAREIILKYFEIIAITELGSQTFMATGTNTVILFLRRRSNYFSKNLEKAIELFFINFQDNTINNIEKPINNYVKNVWKNLDFEDYISLIKKEPNEIIKNHEIYKDYYKNLYKEPKESKNKSNELSELKNEKSIKAEKDFLNKLVEIEKEKILYFLSSFYQEIILVKTNKNGEKNDEKRFLGYEFSYRRGSEGIHPIQRGKTINECTQLFDENNFENPEKASFYIYQAFNKENNKNNEKLDFEFHKNLEENIFKVKLIDLLTFNRTDFEKTISINKINQNNKNDLNNNLEIDFNYFGNLNNSNYELKKLEELLSCLESGKRPKGGVSQYLEGIPSLGGEHIDLNGNVTIKNIKFVPEDYFNKATQGIVENLDILICKDGEPGKVALFKEKDFPFEKAMVNEHVFIIRANQQIINQRYLFQILYSEAGQKAIKSKVTGAIIGGLNRDNFLSIKIPIPPLEIQEKIVKEIELIEQKEAEIKRQIEANKNQIKDIFKSSIENNNHLRGGVNPYKLGEIATIDSGTNAPQGMQYYENGTIPFIRAKNLNFLDLNNYIIPLKENLINDLAIKKFNLKKFKKGTILFAKSGQSINTNNIGILKEDSYIVNHLASVYIEDKILSKYIFEFLKNFKTSNFKNGESDYPLINLSTIKDFQLLIPSLEVQKETINKIDEIELINQKLEEDLNKLPELKQNILINYL